MLIRRRFGVPLGLGFLIFFLGYAWTIRTTSSDYWPSSFDSSRHGGDPKQAQPAEAKVYVEDANYFWAKMPTHFPVQSMRPMPTGKPLTLPKIQASFGKEGGKDREIRLKRQQAVKSSLKRCWKAYGKHAWLEDELTPVSGSSRNTFGGWGATLVDSLDTLWIMGLQEEFEQAATAAVAINFETSTFEEVNAFETTIRYLGGFLAAYDLSGDTRLLRKAREVGDMLYKAFDTPNRMPMPRWNFAKALANTAGEAPLRALVAEIGSLCMEFTRLSLVTGNPKWFDATERITDALKSQQNETQLPGMWPITVNPFKMKFTDDNTFSLGARADSTFEYLPKMVALTGGLLPDYAGMYEDAMKTAIKYNLYRPMVPDEADILIAGSVHTSEQDGEIVTALESEGQHLVCYAGGMLAIGSKLLNIPDHLETARKLVDGCIWTYKSMPLGIMPETFFMDPCESQSKCPWDEVRWKTAVLLHHKKSGDLTQADELISKNRLPKGFTSIPDTRYILRPEAIESIFVLYRVTGKKDLLESAWAIFQSIQKYTETDLANSALKDVTIANGDPLKMDSMESFWMGETLKYFYLIFSEPDLISLDEFVFNTEAHPLRRLGA